jgi:hypothetical protein
MAQCYLCGSYIPRGGGVRRQVYTGSTHGVSFGSRGSARMYHFTRYGLRTVCVRCAKILSIEDTYRAREAWAFIPFTITLIWVLLAALRYLPELLDPGRGPYPGIPELLGLGTTFGWLCVLIPSSTIAWIHYLRVIHPRAKLERDFALAQIDGEPRT